MFTNNIDIILPLLKQGELGAVDCWCCCCCCVEIIVVALLPGKVAFLLWRPVYKIITTAEMYFKNKKREKKRRPVNHTANFPSYSYVYDFLKNKKINKQHKTWSSTRQEDIDIERKQTFMLVLGNMERMSNHHLDSSRDVPLRKWTRSAAVNAKLNGWPVTSSAS